MPFYFAYGSNMNPQRVRDRGLAVLDSMPGRLPGMGLRFNKRSRHNPNWACANIIYAPGEAVEGVLYRLADHGQIRLMDPFEGAPRYYSRERFTVITSSGEQPAWTYVANPAVIDNRIRPLPWYLGQLLEGRAYLSPDYLEWLKATPCCDDDHAGWG